MPTCDGACVQGVGTPRPISPYISLHLRISPLYLPCRASELLAALSEEVAASAGAACHTDATSVSAVLRAMRVPHEYAVGTPRGQG